MDGVAVLESALKQGWVYREVRLLNSAQYNHLRGIAGDGHIGITGHFNSPNPSRPTTGLVISTEGLQRLQEHYERTKVQGG